MEKKNRLTYDVDILAKTKKKHLRRVHLTLLCLDTISETKRTQTKQKKNQCHVNACVSVAGVFLFTVRYFTVIMFGTVNERMRIGSSPKEIVSSGVYDAGVFSVYKKAVPR